MKNNWTFPSKAQEKVAAMEKNYKKEIQKSIENTKIYNTGHVFPEKNRKYETVVTVEPLDSVSAVLRVCKENPGTHTAVLNFASFKQPGGLFLEGSMAQEEALCHESLLFPVLRSFDDSYYKENRKHLNRALYHDRALFSKDILFKRKDEIADASVITCAAPNKKAAMTYQSDYLTEEDCNKAMKDRIHFLLSVAAEEKVDNLILGAFGCGVFGNSPETVAHIFRDFLTEEFSGVFQKVIFAVMSGGSSKNLEVFQETMKMYVLVSQGIAIYRTTDKEEAQKMMDNDNEKYWKYYQKCADEREPAVDNEVFMYEETLICGPQGCNCDCDMY